MCGNYMSHGVCPHGFWQAAVRRKTGQAAEKANGIRSQASSGKVAKLAALRQLRFPSAAHLPCLLCCKNFPADSRLLLIAGERCLRKEGKPQKANGSQYNIGDKAELSKNF